MNAIDRLIEVLLVECEDSYRAAAAAKLKADILDRVILKVQMARDEDVMPCQNQNNNQT